MTRREEARGGVEARRGLHTLSPRIFPLSISPIPPMPPVLRLPRTASRPAPRARGGLEQLGPATGSGAPRAAAGARGRAGPGATGGAPCRRRLPRAFWLLGGYCRQISYDYSPSWKFSGLISLVWRVTSTLAGPPPGGVERADARGRSVRRRADGAEKDGRFSGEAAGAQRRRVPGQRVQQASHRLHPQGGFTAQKAGWRGSGAADRGF